MTENEAHVLLGKTSFDRRAVPCIIFNDGVVEVDSWMVIRLLAD